MKKHLIYSLLFTLLFSMKISAISIKEQSVISQLKEKISRDMPLKYKQKLGRIFSDALTIAGDNQSKRHERYFGKMQGLSYLQYLNQHVQSFHYSNKEYEAAGAWSDQKTQSIVLPKSFLDYEDDLWNLSLLLHEARHLEEKKKWGHQNCRWVKIPEGWNPHGLLESITLRQMNQDEQNLSTNFRFSPICDRHDKGAYTYQLVFLLNIQKHCSTCSFDSNNLEAQIGRCLASIRSLRVRKSILSDLYQSL